MLRTALMFCLALGWTTQVTSAAEFKDDDWNFGLFANCELPKTEQRGFNDTPESARWMDTENGHELVFTLNRGDRGGCEADGGYRHGAKYWERAELQAYQPFEEGKVHDISFTTTIEKGMAGKKETFFQIHGWTKSCRSAPWMMMQFHNRKFRVLVLEGAADNLGNGMLPAIRGDLKTVFTSRRTVDELLGYQMKFDVRLDRRTTPATVSIAVNGQPMIENVPIAYMSCSEPKAKFGIYRPGGNPGTSVVAFDKLSWTEADARSAQPWMSVLTN